MIEKKITLSVDMLGSETKTSEILKGLNQSLLRNINYKFLLYGNEENIHKYIKKYKRLEKASTIFHCEEFVSMSDKPSDIIKSKNTSMFLAIESVKQKNSDAVLSFGNTGALMSLSLLHLKTLNLIKRPAIATIWPNMMGESIVLDLGANTKLDSRYLIDNAILGSSLASILFNISKPSVGLLNVGTEEIKGNEDIRAASEKLLDLNRNNIINYKGFVEGNDISLGKTNVVVTDGFTGNITLKTAEGTAKLFQNHLKDAYRSSIFSRLGYFLSSIALNSVKDRLDPRVHNCGILTGLNSLAVKCHGESEYRGVSYASDIIHLLINRQVNSKINKYVAEIQHKLVE